MCGCRLWTELCTLSTAGCTGHKINIPRQSRGFFICGHSPRILARASRRASTVCQPRKFRYLPPVNGHFRSLAWSAALLLCPARTDIGCTPCLLYTSCPYLAPPYEESVNAQACAVGLIPTSTQGESCRQGANAGERSVNVRMPLIATNSGRGSL